MNLVELRMMAGHGSTTESIVRGVRSALPFVDRVTLANTGLEPAVENGVIAAFQELKVPCQIVSIPWDNDFGSMRNKLLRWPSSCEWLLMLDSDETIDFDMPDGGISIQSKLHANLQFEGASAFIDNGSKTYGQPRFFRVPFQGEFSGVTHEAYDFLSRKWFKLPWIRFVDYSKSDAEYRTKFERDIRLFFTDIVANGPSARKHFYIAESYRNLAKFREGVNKDQVQRTDHENALQHYKLCIQTTGWREEKAWSHYCAAIEASELGRWQEAADLCVDGMQVWPTMPELAWYAAYSFMMMGSTESAVRWAEKAIAINKAEKEERILFTYQYAHSKGPYDVLIACLGKLNRFQEAGKAVAESILGPI
jgi:hypothetical protein